MPRWDIWRRSTFTLLSTHHTYSQTCEIARISPFHVNFTARCKNPSTFQLVYCRYWDIITVATCDTVRDAQPLPASAVEWWTWLNIIKSGKIRAYRPETTTAIFYCSLHLSEIFPSIEQTAEYTRYVCAGVFRFTAHVVGFNDCLNTFKHHLVSP